MTEEELLNSPYALEQAEISKKRARETAKTLKPSEEVWSVVNGLEMLTAETIAILIQRGQEWHDKNRLGEKMFCRDDGYKFILYSNELAQILGCGIRKAQKLLAIVRATLGIVEDRDVTVKEFCDQFKYNEDDFRKALKHADPDYNED
jgi:hypothetical protein